MTTDPKDAEDWTDKVARGEIADPILRAEIARLQKLWDDRDAAWSERVALLTDENARLREELREDRMQVLASDGQAQMAYEARMKAEAEITALADDHARLSRDFTALEEERTQFRVERDAALAQAYEAAEAWAQEHFTSRMHGIYVKGTIRALTPADALTALSRRDAQMRAEGWNAAANWLEKRLNDYVAEHGSYDPSTGVTEFPGNGDEWVYEQEETIDAFRILAGGEKEAPHG